MNITLIGMPGAGKSFFGVRLAENLSCRFIDVDKVIEKKKGFKLQQVIEKLGDEGFLKIEEETILNLGRLNNCVISPGGSVVYSKKAMRFLKKNSIVIFLDAPLESIKRRIANRSTRGIIGLRNKTLEELYEERLVLYRKYADATVKVPDDFNIDSILREIIRKTADK